MTVLELLLTPTVHRPGLQASGEKQYSRWVPGFQGGIFAIRAKKALVQWLMIRIWQETRVKWKCPENLDFIEVASISKGKQQGAGSSSGCAT